MSKIKGVAITLSPIGMRDRAGWDVIPDMFVEERGLLRRRYFDEDA